MTDSKVVPLPLWRTPRRTGVLLVALGALVILFGIGLYMDSLDLEAGLEQHEPPPSPPSGSNPTSTSS